MTPAPILFLAGLVLAVVSVGWLFGPGWAGLAASAVLIFLGISTHIDTKRPAR